MDVTVALWILQFLLRQPPEDRTLGLLLKSDTSLKKLVLLRKLESQVSRKSISVGALLLLEDLAGVEFEGGVESLSDTMRHAYCAVAVDCTLKLLKGGDGWDNGGKCEFSEVVDRVWGGMAVRVKKWGLDSEELWVWKNDIETALWDDSVCGRVIKNGEGIDAAEAVDAYIRIEREKMGPSFLQLVSSKVNDDESSNKETEKEVGSFHQIAGEDRFNDKLGRPEMVSVHEAAREDVVDVNKATKNEVADAFPVTEAEPSHCINQDPDVTNLGNESPKEMIHLRDKHKPVGLRRLRVPVFGHQRGAKIANFDEMEEGPSPGKRTLPHSLEVKKVPEALELSGLDLHAVVKDPLPEALQFSEVVCCKTAENKCQDPAKESRVGANVFISDANGVVRQPDIHVDISLPSLMERNNIAHSFEWDDPVDGLDDNPPMHHLPTPKVLKNSPLILYKATKRRRVPRKWSLLEEDALRTGVEKYGKGNWKAILQAYRDEFGDRTEVDLKDKWRNLIRC